MSESTLRDHKHRIEQVEEDQCEAFREIRKLREEIARQRRDCDFERIQEELLDRVTELESVVEELQSKLSRAAAK
jgi:hypothetical protein